MLKHFGEDYRAYRQRVPGFVPRWGQWRAMARMRTDSSAETDQTPGESGAGSDAAEKDDAKTRFPGEW